MAALAYRAPIQFKHGQALHLPFVRLTGGSFAASLPFHFRPYSPWLHTLIKLGASEMRAEPIM